jgi:hypothetical protein
VVIGGSLHILMHNNNNFLEVSCFIEWYGIYKKRLIAESYVNL